MINPTYNSISLIDIQPKIPTELNEILIKMKVACSRYIFRNDSALTNMIKKIKPVDFRRVLECFFTQMVSEGHEFNAAKTLDRLAAIVPLEMMDRLDKDNIEASLITAKGMLEEAKLYLSKTEAGTSLSIHKSLSGIIDGIVSIIESIITAFGIDSFFKPADGEVQASAKSDRIVGLITLFGMITTMVFPIIGVATGAMILGGTLLAVAALSIIWPFVKPAPTHLPANAEYLNKQVQTGNGVIQGRKTTLGQTANILKMGRHVILVGPSRVGKSLTAKALVQAIERGDYPELAGKRAFRINTADIVDFKASYLGGGNNILNIISQAMGRHRDDIILVLDEIHMACKGNTKIADQLKLFLDEGGEFPHVIAITTEQEYEKYVKDNGAFSLRFDRVDIKNTEVDETLEILSNTILSSRSRPIITEDALETIYSKSQETKGAPQPASALKLLRKCINRTEATQPSATEKIISETAQKILSLRSQCAASRGKKNQFRLEIENLKKQLNGLQETLQRERKEVQCLARAKELFHQTTKEAYKSVLKVAAVSHQVFHSQDIKKLKLSFFMQQFLENFIKDKSKKLGVRSVIDSDLIHEVASI